MGRGINNAFMASVVLLIVSIGVYVAGYSLDVVHLQNIGQEVLGASIAAVGVTLIIKYM